MRLYRLLLQLPETSTRMVTPFGCPTQFLGAQVLAPAHSRKSPFITT
jgi:hypothetical protein